MNAPTHDAPGPSARSDVARPRRRRLLLVGGTILLALVLIGLLPRLALRRRLARDADAARDALPVVETTLPQPAKPVVSVALPATTQPVLVTGIWARTNGYLKTRTVDIGDRVKAGQLLAEIVAPEVDQELSQARATLAESEANVVKLQADLDLAHTTLKRYVAAGAASVSQQQIDVRTSSVTVAEKAVDAARATANASQANVDRLTELQGFQHIYAPFDGIITQRHVDYGSLISAGSTQGTTELFTLAQIDPLRTFVYVPQEYASDVQVGQDADVSERQLPDRVFHGTVSRTAGALDPVSRTLLTEVLVPNHDGALLSGAYVTVTFQLRRATPPLEIPATALLVDAHGTRVAVIAADETLHYRDVDLGRDYGSTVEIRRGIEPTDVIAKRWPGVVADGARVRPAPSPGPGTGAGGA